MLVALWMETPDSCPTLLSLTHKHIFTHACAHTHTVMPQSNILTRVDGFVGRRWLGGPVEWGDGDARLLTVEVPHVQPTDPPGCRGRTTDQVSHSHGAATRSTHVKISSHNTVDAWRFRFLTVMVLRQGQHMPRYPHTPYLHCFSLWPRYQSEAHTIYACTYDLVPTGAQNGGGGVWLSIKSVSNILSCCCFVCAFIIGQYNSGNNMSSKSGAAGTIFILKGKKGHGIRPLKTDTLTLSAFNAFIHVNEESKHYLSYRFVQIRYRFTQCI